MHGARVQTADIVTLILREPTHMDTLAWVYSTPVSRSELCEHMRANGLLQVAQHAFACRSFKIAQVWMPVNLIFVGMIWTSFFALKNLGVPMATVLKNVTNLFTIVGDYLLYGKVREWASLALLCMSVLSGFITDPAFKC